MGQPPPPAPQTRNFRHYWKRPAGNSGFFVSEPRNPSISADGGGNGGNFVLRGPATSVVRGGALEI
jgi:hypothetical protein